MAIRRGVWNSYAMDNLPPETAFVIDLNRIPRGKRIPAADWPDLAAREVGFSASALVLDARGNARGP